jgi:hypothetical protein
MRQESVGPRRLTGGVLPRIRRGEVSALPSNARLVSDYGRPPGSSLGGPAGASTGGTSTGGAGSGGMPAGGARSEQEQIEVTRSTMFAQSIRETYNRHSPQLGAATRKRAPIYKTPRWLRRAFGAVFEGMRRFPPTGARAGHGGMAAPALGPAGPLAQPSGGRVWLEAPMRAYDRVDLRPRWYRRGQDRQRV